MTSSHERFDWRKVILSQYDNSPALLTLAEGLGKMFSFDNDIDAFYDKVFNIGGYLDGQASPINKYGLKVWSDIVACNRLVETSQPIDEEYDHIYGQDDASCVTMTVICAVTGTSGTVIPSDSIVSYDSVQFTSNKDVTIASSGITYAKFHYRSTTTPPSEADTIPSGTTMTIVTPVSGWTSCVTAADSTSTNLGNFDNNLEIYSDNSGGTFAREATYGSSVDFTDEQLRRLILLKAMFNVISPTLPNINKWVKTFFAPYQLRGSNAFVEQTDTMQITLFTNFKLSSYFKVIIFDAGVFPRPAGVELIVNDTFNRVIIRETQMRNPDYEQLYSSASYALGQTTQAGTDVVVEADTDEDPFCISAETIDDVPSTTQNGTLILLQQPTEEE